MSSTAKSSGARPEMPAATAMRIAQGSRTMLKLVEGHPEFERLASLLDRARSEALRVLHLHGLASPPAGLANEPTRHEPLDHDR